MSDITREALDIGWMRDSFHHLRKAVGVYLRPASDGTADWVLLELRKLERQFAALTDENADLKARIEALEAEQRVRLGYEESIEYLRGIIEAALAVLDDWGPSLCGDTAEETMDDAAAILRGEEA